MYVYCIRGQKVGIIDFSDSNKFCQFVPGWHRPFKTAIDDFVNCRLDV